MSGNGDPTASNERINPSSALSVSSSPESDSVDLESSLGESPLCRDDLEQTYAHCMGLPNSDEKVKTLGIIGIKYQILYGYSQDIADLEKSISIQREAVDGGPFHAHRAHHLEYLGSALQDRYDYSGDLVDIEEAIQASQNALSLTQQDAPERAERLMRLASNYNSRFEHLGDVADIELVVATYIEAVALMPEGSPVKATLHNNFAGALLQRFERLGALEDLDEAIVNVENAVRLTPDGHSDKPSRYNNLGDALMHRFERLGDLSDLENGISNNENAVNLTPDGHPDKPTLYNNLGSALLDRFEHLGDLADLETAIFNFKNAVKFTPDGHPDKPSWYNNLGNALQCRFQHLGDLTDLENAISNHKNAVNLTPDGHLDKPSWYSNLGNALKCRFERLGESTDIESAIFNLENAVTLTLDDHPDKPSWYNNLGNALRHRFERLGVLTDFERAISNLENAENLTPNEHPDKPSRYSNLGNALQSRFLHLGDLADLENAIFNHKKAVNLTPDGHPAKPSWHGNLGDALRCRFERLNDPTDIERAIFHNENAVNLTPDGHPDKSSWYNNLGNALEYRFQHLYELTDLERAISNYEMAVNLTPDGHLDKPSRYGNLGNALRCRFERLDDPVDLDRAISNHKNALDLMPDQQPDKPTQYSSLGNSLRCRFEHLGDPADLEDAISNHKNAMNLALEGRPDNVIIIFHLASCHEARFDLLAEDTDLDSACSLYATAAQSSSGYPQWRFDAALAWSRCTKLKNISPLPAFRCAIDQLPRIAWLGIPISEQHSLLEKIGGAVRDAVAAAVEAEEYEIAVEWTEQGRSIVWQNLLKLRIPVDELSAVHPELAAQLRSVSQRLDSPAFREFMPQGYRDMQPQEVTKSHTSLAIEWDQTVEEIRKLPHFESFLKPKGFNSLFHAAHKGPVVILNVATDRCDAVALIPGSNTVASIPLSNFSLQQSEKLLLELIILLGQAQVRDRGLRKVTRERREINTQKAVKAILSTLWVAVVKPVLDGLAYQPRSSNLPRIWWCATGPLSLLPIHAAGDYDATIFGQKLADYAVSSYTPTLTAVLDLSHSIPSDDFKLLLVAQPAAPNHTRIPKTMDEVERIEEIASGIDTVSLTKEQATVERVHMGMKESNWIHLACHGKQDVSKAIESGLILHDGTLKLSTIIKEPLPKAEFAFLSACQTAKGDKKLAEESAHLAAGMLLAGYRGVIATMWSIKDEDGPKVAEGVYSRMLKDGKPDRREAAHALHEAVRELRESGADFLSWVPFIHIGQ